MNLNTVAIIISITSFVASIASTVWVKHMANTHEERMFQLDFYVKHRAEILELYLKNVGALIASKGNSTALSDYRRSYGEAFLYLPDDLHNDAVSLNTLLVDGCYIEAESLFMSFCKRLALEIKPANIAGKKKTKQRH